jgi:hypothetical protein
VRHTIARLGLLAVTVGGCSKTGHLPVKTPLPVRSATPERVGLRTTVVHPERRSGAEAAPEDRARLLAQLNGLGKEIETIDPLAKVDQLLLQLETIAASPWMMRPVLIPAARNGFELKSWWQRGGNDALRAWLSESKDIAVWFTPDLIGSLGSDTDPDHNLLPLLCPITQSECGSETRAWEIRAHHSLVDLAERDRMLFPSHESSSNATDCEKEALAAEPEQQFAAWLGCTEMSLPAEPTFPLGHLRVPRDGWLLLHQHGGEQECSRARAYRLRSGAVFEVLRCPDGKGTPSGLRFRLGETRLELLQETGWFLLIAPEIQSLRVTGQAMALPASIELIRTEDIFGPQLPGLFSGVSGALEVDYGIYGATKNPVNGSIQLNVNDEAIQRYTSSLLEALAASFQDAATLGQLPENTAALLAASLGEGITERDILRGFESCRRKAFRAVTTQRRR